MDTSLLIRVFQDAEGVMKAHPGRWKWRKRTRFLGLAVYHGLQFYVENVFSEQKPQDLLRSKERPLQSWAPKSSTTQESKIDLSNVNVIALLLHYGADPNQRYKNMTVWHSFLNTYCVMQTRPSQVFGLRKTIELFWCLGRGSIWSVLLARVNAILLRMWLLKCQYPVPTKYRWKISLLRPPDSKKQHHYYRSRSRVHRSKRKKVLGGLRGGDGSWEDKTLAPDKR